LISYFYELQTLEPTYVEILNLNFIQLYQCFEIQLKIVKFKIDYILVNFCLFLS